jgi:hypothetical protein
VSIVGINAGNSLLTQLALKIFRPLPPAIVWSIGYHVFKQMCVKHHEVWYKGHDQTSLLIHNPRYSRTFWRTISALSAVNLQSPREAEKLPNRTA